jgi:hypothetical protein
MKPASPVFPDRYTSQVVFAEHQPEYVPLPAYKEADGRITTRWSLSVIERIEVLLDGRMWLQVSTFNHPRQPARISATEAGFDIDAKGQPHYARLPSHNTDDGMRTVRWRFSPRDRLRMFFTGNVWLQIMTFNKPLQALKLSTVAPEIL